MRGSKSEVALAAIRGRQDFGRDLLVDTTLPRAQIAPWNQQAMASARCCPGVFPTPLILFRQSRSR